MKLNKTIKTLCSVVALAAVTGCGETTSNNPHPKTDKFYVEATPLSVESVGSGSYGSLSVVVSAKGKKVLAYGGSSTAHTAANASALIKSEIEDSDYESIMLYGNYDEKGLFKLKSIEVEGYTINF